MEPLEPILRWAGGKRQIIRDLLAYLPPDASDRVYREPFLGAASVFLALMPRTAFVSDANSHLIHCYQHVRDDPARVARHLRVHAQRNSESHYYRVRRLYNQRGWSAAQAARFIYMNRTGYNGVFRVNRAGAYNVPYGDKPQPRFPDAAWLRRISEVLASATLSVASFEDALAPSRAGDFIYLDPPYPPLNGTSFFTHYTMDRFVEGDQLRLAALVRDLDCRGCLVLMTNADTPLIRKLYKGFDCRALSVTRFVSAKKVKHRVRELVITNYDTSLCLA